MDVETAFLSAAAQDLFASTAAFGDARELEILDVTSGQAAARLAIETAISNAMDRSRSYNPGVRIALVKGDAGSGKSHVLTTTFKRASFSDEVYPAVLQLTAPVDKSDYVAWLVDAVFRQLAARHFSDGENRSPLRRLAERLLDRLDVELRAAFVAAFDDLDGDDEFAIALRIGRHLRLDALRRLSEDPPEAAFIAVVILAGFGQSAALRYLRAGQVGKAIGAFDLPAIATSPERIGVLRDLGLTAQIVDAALALGFDQVENIVKLSGEDIFVHAISQAVRVAETIANCAVIIVALGNAYDDIVGGHRTAAGLPVSDQDRIEREAPLPVRLEPGPATFYRDVVAQRLAVLRGRTACSAASHPLAPLPDWLLAGLDGKFNVRSVLREVSDFRTLAIKLARLPTLAEFAPSAPAPPVSQEDFDKEWADFQDRSSASPRLLVETKADLVAWWVDNVGRERDGLDTARASLTVLDDAFATPVVDVELKMDGTLCEIRRLALCEAPNRNKKLADQITGFLETAGGTPFILRTNGFPRGRTTQVAPSLRLLECLFGSRLDLNEVEWTNLLRAKEFSDERHAQTGFEGWQRDRQWLTQLLAPLQPLIQQAATSDQVVDLAGGGANPAVSPEPTEAVVSGVTTRTRGAPAHATASSEPFPVCLGESAEGASVWWDPFRAAPDHLNNFSFLATGDAGSGKTQTIRVLIDAACRAGLAVTIFDFKADYCDPAFATPLGLDVIEVRVDGLPFNPMEPPPRGASGVQPIEHAYEIGGILKRVFRLGDIQEGALREAICKVYADAGIDPHEWTDPSKASWPSFDKVLAHLKEDGKSASLVTRLSVLGDLGLFPAANRSGASFEEFLSKRVCLKLSDLPTDEVKSALAEILIVQLHGYAVRREQPRRLVHMWVFDEAHRVKDSKRLETLAREGRAFGVGIVLGTQFPGDIPESMAGNLATQVSLMNNQAGHRRTVVAQLLGTTSSPEAKTLLDSLSSLRPLEGLFSNTHHAGIVIRVKPHYLRAKERLAD